MGPQALTDALLRGGRFYDEFPANLENYMDGLIKRHWASNKAEGCTFLDPDNVSQFVCWIVVKLASN